MPLYQRVNGKIHALTPRDLLGQKPGDYILYDAGRRVYDLYRVEAAGKFGKSLSRFSITENHADMTGDAYSYDAQTEDFKPIPDAHTARNHPKAMSRALQKFFFNETEESVLSILPAELFPAEIVKAINKHNHPKWIVEGLKALKHAQILDKNTIAALFEHKNTESFASGLEVLKKANMLDDKTHKDLCAHQNPQSLALGLEVLKKANMLDDKTRQDLHKHQNPQALALGFKMLDETLYKNNHNVLCDHQNPESLAKGLLALKKYDSSVHRRGVGDRLLLTQHQNPESLAEALIILDKKKIVDEEIRHIVCRLQDPLSLAKQFEEGELYMILNAVTDLQKFINKGEKMPRGSKEKADELCRYTIEQIQSVAHSAQDNTVEALKGRIGQNVFNKAKKLWGTEHQNARVILDALLILLSAAGVGLLLIGAKKVATGHCFFHIGKGSERKVIDELGSIMKNK